jgi:heme exporter protein C
MWTFLYQLASPRTFYTFSERMTPWSAYFAVLLLTIGFVWGLFFAPADYQQGDAFRILYVHVPCAFLSVGLYAFLGFLALLLLVWQIKLAGIMMRFVAQLGASMTFLALVTGSIWGKPMWGAWWVWDARLTSELILLLLYISILATSHAFQEKDRGDKIVAILCLVGLVDLPIIHYSVYWWNTLHQGSTLFVLAKPKIHISMLYPLIFILLGCVCYCTAVILSKTRTELLWRERRQNWVKVLMERALCLP